MAYFTQAGAHQAYSQEGFQERDSSSNNNFQQSTDTPNSSYSGPGTETYAQSAYDSTLYAAPSQGFAAGAQDYAPPSAEKRDWTRTLGIMGGVASLALAIGVGYWGYNLITRDVTGIPVVRAAEGPLRISPEEPGGRPADNQGLAVNEVAATGTAAAPADRLTLAPAELDLSADDKTFAQLSEIETLNTPVNLDLAVADIAPTRPTPARPEGVQSNDIDALVARLTEGVEPIAGVSDIAGNVTQVAALAPAIVPPEPLTQIEPVVASIVLDAPGVRVSLRPAARPARFTPASLSASAPAEATSQAIDVDPTSLPTGTRLAQLGAYESAEVARSEWTRISARFSDYLTGKQRVIQRAESGGRTFYRLRAMGFDDLSDARRFCAALVAGSADCIPVTTR
ncbi:SPOR domain-containing protein [Epibacterium ulvae]|uniref:SPOR domain-containing protein n=1 Tax=Epibacterium ulvae TaxID=1156985 RepID=UPI001BFCD111|nr:SPOR domain-containing protein [Epibacterium ulvae]MBT8155257.1 SPOR domain-containing protein [Epibacterium ulvae]